MFHCMDVLHPADGFLPRGARDAAAGRRKSFNAWEPKLPSHLGGSPEAIPCDSRASRAVRARRRGEGRKARASAAGAAGGNRMETMNFLNFTSDAGLIFHPVSAMCPPSGAEAERFPPRFLLKTTAGGASALGGVSDRPR